MTGNEVEKVEAKRDALTPQQRIGAAMAAAGRTDSEIAEEVGLKASTVATWRKRPTFKAEMNRVLDRLQKDIARRGFAAVPKAMQYLISVLDDPTASHTQKTNAAKILLDRFPAFTPEMVAETDAALVADKAPRALTAEEQKSHDETLLEVYREMAKIEAARASQRQPIVVDYDDDEEEDEPRVIVGEVVEENEPKPVPVGEITRRPKVVTKPMTERDLQRMARGRGLGGGSRV